MASWCYIFAQGAGCLPLLRVYDQLTRVIITLISSFIIYKYGLLIKCEVKMAGYWPSSFSFTCLWTETELRSINSQEKNEVNIQPS